MTRHMTGSQPPSRALLIIAGVMTQLMGGICFILALASLPVAHDLKTGMGGVLASIVASLAAIVCGTLAWRGRLVPLALAAGLDIGFGVGLPRGGSAIGAMLHILPADEASTAETLIMVAAVMMFVAAIICVLSVPAALKLRRWAREEIARTDPRMPVQSQAADTLRGFTAQKPQKLYPTMVIRPAGLPPKNRLLIIIGVALTIVALGIVVITAATSGGSAAAVKPSEGSGSDVAKLRAIDAGVDEVDPFMLELPTLDEFIARFHAALAKPADLPLLFQTNAFGFGVDSHSVAETRDDLLKQLHDDIGAPAPVTVKFSHVASEGDVGWFAEELRVGGKTFVISAVAGISDGAWTIYALHWASAMPNAEAYRLARSGDLAIPDAIPDNHDTTQLAVAMKTAFSSKPSFVEARSTRADAFNFGSAGERLKGGETIRKLFSRLRANIRLHDAVKVGMIGERGGWGAANVEFTDADRDGTEVTQTFRVLTAWVKEDAGWRMTMTQWSNPR